MNINSFENKISFQSVACDKIADNIGEYVLKFRRPFKNEYLSSNDKKYLLSEIKKSTMPFIIKEEPINIAIVGFSLKCPSPVKTISQNADRAEFEALNHLNNVVKGISDIYKPGGTLNIFADGRMFVNSIWGFSDEKVSNYIAQLKIF